MTINHAVNLIGLTNGQQINIVLDVSLGVFLEMTDTEFNEVSGEDPSWWCMATTVGLYLTGKEERRKIMSIVEEFQSA